MRFQKYFLYISLVASIILVLLVGNVVAVKMSLTDYSTPKDTVKWSYVPGENYVKHVYKNSSLINNFRSIYIFDKGHLQQTNICNYISMNLANRNIRIDCASDANFVSIIVFKDALVSREELIKFFSSIDSNVEVNVFFVPYEVEDYYTLTEMMNKGDVLNKIKEELFSIFGEEKFREVFGIGQTIYDNGVIEIYADNFSDEEITLIFKTIRKYIPENVRFTILLYHFIPESQPLIGEPNNLSYRIDENSIYLITTAILFIAVVSIIYFKRGLT